MNKSQFLRILENKLPIMEAAKLTQLVVDGNFTKAREVLEQFEYNSLVVYLKSEQFKKLEVWEIPQSYKITFIWYMFQSGRNEEELLREPEEWKKDLLQFAQTQTTEMADLIRKIVGKLDKYHFINDYSSLEELLK